MRVREGSESKGRAWAEIVPSPVSWKFGTSALTVSKELMGEPDKKRSHDIYYHTEACYHTEGCSRPRETGPACSDGQRTGCAANVAAPEQ